VAGGGELKCVSGVAARCQRLFGLAALVPARRVSEI